MAERCLLREPGAVARGVEVLKQGGVIVYPTETVYGIGANALNAAAVEKIHQVKRRNDGKPILVLVSSMSMLRQVVTDIPPHAVGLIRAFWPGPLTLVFRAVEGLPMALTQGTGTIGVRIPPHDFCLALARECGFPITSTSANISGMPVPGTVTAIEEQLDTGIDLFIDAGELPPSPPSSVVDVTEFPPKILRIGAISLERLNRILSNNAAAT